MCQAKAIIKSKIKLLTDTAKIPSYAHEGDIGADVFSDEDVAISAGSRKLVSTGISLEASRSSSPFGYFRVAPRSGLSVKGIDIGAGVVDLSYRGEVKVLVINNSGFSYNVNKGDKIAQLIFETACEIDFSLSEELSHTQRSDSGFGSTG